MRPCLRAVSVEIFQKSRVDREPLLQVYITELNDVNDIRQMSVRKIMRLKGENKGGVILLYGPARGLV